MPKLPYRTQAVGGNDDVQWHEDGPHAAKPRFIYNQAQNTRPQQGTRSSVVGDIACAYGPATFYRCGEIETTGYAPSYIANSYGFVRVFDCSEDLVAGGDSGGPVFLGYKALGIVSGGTYNAPCGSTIADKLIYSKINAALTELDLDLYISQ